LFREDQKSLTTIIPFKTYCNAIDRCQADVSLSANVHNKTSG